MEENYTTPECGQVINVSLKKRTPELDLGGFTRSDLILRNKIQNVHVWYMYGCTGVSWSRHISVNMCVTTYMRKCSHVYACSYIDSICVLTLNCYNFLMFTRDKRTLLQTNKRPQTRIHNELFRLPTMSRCRDYAVPWCNPLARSPQHHQRTLVGKWKAFIQRGLDP